MKICEAVFYMAVGAVAMLLIASIINKVSADDDPPKTTLTICAGGLPSLSILSNAQDGCHSVDVSAQEVENADLIYYNPSQFSHEYRLNTGDAPACIFTEDEHKGKPVMSSVAGGRDCRPEDHQCAYISQGFHTWAITGKSCQEAGVPECEGLFCR